MKKHLFKNLILLLTAITTVFLAVWMPGFVMQKTYKAKQQEVMNVPSEYYSGPSSAVIKNASRQLTSSQCIRLITGSWDSNIHPASDTDTNMSSLGIKSLTVTRVEDLYTKGLYPVSISSKPGNWYSWSTTPYLALDSTFRTYAAPFWEVDFLKYDNTEAHRFIVTESGDILYAEYKSFNMDKEKSLSNFTPKLSNSSYLLYHYGEYTTTTINNENLRVLVHGNETSTYRTGTASEASKASLDTERAKSFIEGFNAFEPDDVYFLFESSDNGTSDSTKYLISYKKDSVKYMLLMVPEN